ncbi:TonB-dependent receptor [Chryseobacterium carnipullorum]|uniref:Outer membrane cobalamin receptor protein n=1 Tax=Chryseobacterium carnipullorum TaxID=1124835 RepID=A0A376EHT8_CHRCU|nr:outer membrane beta-barrel family protein [Chryseobacterium carnipullorum]AZA47207.1 TonB-dependent receptor [Chryseobacterium carnipullorum]AZA66554.1 TonB-dependent receptor [Chryseobacterium carnipullorum]STD08654.1 Outer membrane cobalamin receptor protein [Chryseobacterium carnipullorum]
MRNIILVVLIFCSQIFLSQNVQITGRILNNENSPVEFAEVILLKNDSVKIRSEITNANGMFTIDAPKDSYILQVKRFKGILYSKKIKLENNLRLNEIKLVDIQQIKEVIIEKKKKLIEKKIDRTVFNVENSIFSSGADLAQVLSGTPMLSVSDNSVSIVGKSGVAVMVNDKLLNLSGTDLINYLRSLRSDDVSRVEIITTPPAKYEAQGNSGILNIILKKNTKLGWNGILSSSYIQTTYVGNANNLTLNYNSNKITSSLRLRQFDRPSKAVELIDIIGTNSILSADKRKDKFKGAGANFSFDYKLNQNSNIGVIYDISKSHSDMDIFNRSIYQTNSIQDSLLTTSSEHRKPIVTHSLNAYYDYKIDSLGKKLNIAGNYFSNSPDAEVNFQTISDYTPGTQKIRNLSNLDYQILSGQADLYLPFKWGTLETGLKFTHFLNGSNIKYFSFKNDEYTIDPSRSNYFEYKENNAAAYVSVYKSLGEKWSAKAGLRYEYSTIDGYSETAGERNKNEYGRLFPSAYLEYKANENNTLSINYSKRINRPNFTALNPFRWYSNPYSFYTGNPFLSPSYNHNVELSYLYKNRFSVTVYGQKLINGYGRITSLTQGIKEVNYKNYLTQYDAGLNASLYTNVTKWWENNTNIVSFYSESESSIPEVVPQKGVSMYYTINNTFTINKEKSVLFLLNFYHYLPNKQGNTYIGNISNLSAGFRFSLMEKKLRVNMMVEDIFRGTQSKGKIFYDEFTQFYNNYYDTRRFTLNMTYTFGNKNVKTNNKQIQLEEKSRAN